MNAILRPALPIGARDPFLREDAAWAERVRIVLETRPGTLPWRPDFGCDLAGLLGQPASPARLGEVRWKIEQAVRRWVPSVRVARCRVTAIPLHEGADSVRSGSAPLAELALLCLGTQVVLEVSLDVETPQGPLALSAQLAP